MAQNRIPRGEHGDLVVRQQPGGGWLARAQVRDLDGRIRSVRVADQTKGAATRRLQRRLAERSDPTITGVTADTTFAELAQHWLQHRADHGKVRSVGTLAPQTLATYNAEINHVIVPAIGHVRVREATVPFLDRLFADVEHGREHGRYSARAEGRSTRQLRVVLGGMLGLAVAHGALPSNPIRDAAKPARQPRREVEYLTVEQAIHLRRRVRREAMRVPARRMPNPDLEEFVDVLLATGCREGEALAIRPMDLVDFDGDNPLLHVCGTLIEPRKGFIEKLHRQDATKTRDDRHLVLPDAAVAVLRQRMNRQPPSSPEAPVFASATRNWISPANMRSRLRSAIDRALVSGERADQDLRGVSLHTLRRTVGTLLAHEVSLDAARDQLGHRDPSVTYQHYVGRRRSAPDVRGVLNRLLAPIDASTPASDP